MAVLTVNDDVTIPGVVICLHVETIPEPHASNPKQFTHKLRCWGAVAGRIENGKWTREKSRSGTDSLGFFGWLNSVRILHRPTWVFVKQMPTSMTVLQLWSSLESGEFSLHRRPTPQTEAYRAKRGDREPDKAIPGLLITAGPPDAVVCYHKSGWKLIILDCANFWETVPVGTVANQCDQNARTPATDAPLANWLSYSINKSRMLSSAVCELLVWHRRQELGRFGFSVAGCALAAFRHRFMCHRIECPDDQDDRDREREGYYPGRVEAFWVGSVDGNSYTPVAAAEDEPALNFDVPRPPFYHLDARSFYGAIGAFESLPCACVESCENSPDGRPPTSGRIVEYLASVEISTQSDVYPVRHAGRVMYARGSYRTVLAGPELARAHRNGHIKNWYWWRRYELEPIFQAYSLKMWEQREETAAAGQHAVNAICKSMLARLHGKFLQRRNRWEPRPKMRATAAWARWTVGSSTTGIYRKFRAIGWDVEEEVDAGDAVHCFPAIAAWVASHGREWLRTWMEIAGKGNVLYVATDSLIVTEDGKRRLEDRGIIWESGIGSCRVVATVDSLSINGANNLRIGPRRVLAGRAETATALSGGLGTPVVTDSLRAILFVRNGRTVQSSVQHWTEPQPAYQQRIGLGGWLEPPQVKKCSEPFRSPELASVSSS